MPMFKIFVGNLDPKVTVEMLKPMFEAFGELDEVIVAKDEDGKSRGFAIVLYKDAMKGQLAIETLTGRKILGREIVINEAMKKGKKKLGPAETEKPRGPFGPKFRAGPGAGPRASFGSNRPIGRAGGFARGGAAGAGPGSGAAGGRPGGASGSPRGSSRNPRRGFSGGPRPGGPAPGAGGGPSAGRPPAGGAPKPAPEED